MEAWPFRPAGGTASFRIDSQPPPRPEEIAAIFAAVRAELASREWDSIEELEAHMGRFMARQNAAPSPTWAG